MMNITDTKRAVLECIGAGVVPLMIGSPGTAKSATAHEIARENELFVIDLRLSQCDPTDLNGFPTRTQDGTRMEWVPPQEIPLEGDPIPEGYAGWMLFLDELTSANQSMQTAAYKLILDRKVGQRKLHPACVIVAAGNRDTDRAATNRLGTALINRMTRLDVEIHLNEWINNYALPKGIDHRILAFLRFQPDLFYKFDPNSPDPAYPTARSWEFASRLMPKDDPNGKLSAFHCELIGGVVGQATAVTMNGFLDCYAVLPDPDEIVLHPERAPVPEEPGQLYAIATMIPRKITKGNVMQILKYVQRLPPEHQMVVMKDAMKLDRSLVMNSDVMNWMSKHVKEIFD